MPAWDYDLNIIGGAPAGLGAGIKACGEVRRQLQRQSSTAVRVGSVAAGAGENYPERLKQG